MESLNKAQLLTGVWQNGGISAKLSICASNPPLRQLPNRYAQV
jgi:hypothetical protein